jgi:hypothetical protein
MKEFKELRPLRKNSSFSLPAGQKRDANSTKNRGNPFRFSEKMLIFESELILST